MAAVFPLWRRQTLAKGRNTKILKTFEKWLRVIHEKKTKKI